MKALIFAMIAGLTAQAHADGFVCYSDTEHLKVHVYNQVDPSQGTRNAAVMVLSDSQVGYGNKTIAKFDANNSVLSNSGATYQANVDLRYSDSNRSGENIAGTKLGYIDTIKLDVNFSYASPTEAGADTPAVLTINKRGGDVITVDMECTRYLKN